MKKFFIIIISTAIVSIIGIWILLSYDCLKSQFEIVKDVLGVFQIVLSVFIAYLLYDRFGTSKKLLDKQNDLIIEFLEELKKIRLQIHGLSVEGKKTIIHIGISKNMSLAKNSVVAKKIALFQSEQFYSELKTINDIIEHPLFPPEIKNTVDIFKFGEMTSTLNESVEKFGLISFRHENPKKNEIWMYPYNGDMTIMEYLEKIENAILQLEKWINKESSIKIKLNLG